ncbi:gliding motility lipoprotein GldD [Mesonia sp. K7]|uniref:gliding motility lipoprotein GldD n=1 Tax=Mesonia sp. K7 TaxID=2218606 RepID=UPI000DA9E536|nr:gliding motility lipoprotein GldD [Mesonia sp. K7]PZD78956.1 gliding motility lipoprotein GldD [Mesonia sp. K7]
MKTRLLFILLSIIGFVSCEESLQPKPKAYLALNYEEASYKELPLTFCPYTFEVNKNVILKDAKTKQACWVNLEYPSINGTIFITYKPITDNLKELIIDGQKLPLEHTVKADEIEGDLYVNDENKTYGMLYEVKGNAASQAQFYVTDSIKHFLTGSIYFDAKPNFDSILPAAAYLKNDMRHLIETIKWK